MLFYLEHFRQAFASESNCDEIFEFLRKFYMEYSILNIIQIHYFAYTEQKDMSGLRFL